MKRIALLISLVLAAPAFAADEKLEAVRAKMAAMFDQIEPQHVDYGPIDGWYKVQKGSILAYVSEDGRYLMQGDMIDLDRSINLSEIARDEARRDMLANLADDQVIAFTPEDVTHSVTIFTDVDCTFCRRLHAQIDQYNGLGIEVRYVLYPRGGPASKSWNVSEDIWCASDRQGALTAAKLDRTFATHKCDASIVSKHYIMGQESGLTGTPAIVFPDGSLMSGWLQPAELKQHLDRMAALNTAN